MKKIPKITIITTSIIITIMMILTAFAETETAENNATIQIKENTESTNTSKKNETKEEIIVEVEAKIKTSIKEITNKVKNFISNTSNKIKNTETTGKPAKILTFVIIITAGIGTYYIYKTYKKNKSIK